MQAISLFDKLHIVPSAFDIFTCSDATIPTDESNLVLKALALFRQLTGDHRPFAIHLQKNIPAQAGLGGGSGNAATTLYAINQICGSPLSPELLQEKSALLGADVPFFFSSGTAYCSGIGEIVENLPFQEGECTIIKPHFGVSTAGVYATCIPNACSSEHPKTLLESNALVNDLEWAVFKSNPSMQLLKERLQEEKRGPLVMTGSGSSFVCYGKNAIEPKSDLEIFCVKHIQRKSKSWYASP